MRHKYMQYLSKEKGRPVVDGIFLVDPKGLEPFTSAMRMQRSTR